MHITFRLSQKFEPDPDALLKRMWIAEFKKLAPEIDNYLHLIKWGKKGAEITANFKDLPIEIVRKLNRK